MAGCGCNTTCSPTQKISPKFRKALWIALVLNALMFFVEMIGGSHARSVSLWADALDFAGDAANYAISLAVLSMTLYWRATAALLKGITMAAFGIFVIIKVIWSWWLGVTPEPMLMGTIGLLALVVNVVVALMFPDLFVAFVIAYLGVSSGVSVIKQARAERKQDKTGTLSSV